MGEMRYIYNQQLLYTLATVSTSMWTKSREMKRKTARDVWPRWTTQFGSCQKSVWDVIKFGPKSEVGGKGTLCCFGDLNDKREFWYSSFIWSTLDTKLAKNCNSKNPIFFRFWEVNCWIVCGYFLLTLIFASVWSAWILARLLKL